MKIILNIEESKVDFFLELLHNFDFVQVEISDNSQLSKEHLDILEERLAAYEANPGHLLAWEDVKDSIENGKSVSPSSSITNLKNHGRKS